MRISQAVVIGIWVFVFRAWAVDLPLEEPLRILMQPSSGIFTEKLIVNFKGQNQAKVYFSLNATETFSDLSKREVFVYEGRDIELTQPYGVISALAIDTSGRRSQILRVPFKRIDPNSEIFLEDFLDWPGLTEEQKNQKALSDWLTVYFKKDSWAQNNDFQQMATLALIIRGERLIPQIEGTLQRLSPAQEPLRKALVMALGEIAQELAQATEDGMRSGRKKIDRIFLDILRQTEAALIEGEVKNPETIPLGVVSRDGVWVQTYFPSKVAALEAIKRIGDVESDYLLEAIANSPDQYTESIAHAAEQLRSNQGFKQGG